MSFDSCSELCFEQGDFFGLDDLFTERPDVRNGLADVYASWIRRYKIDGFRIDTARHVDRAFFRLWTPRILRAARAAGVPDFQIFGEAFISDAVELSAFVRDRGLPTVLDFPLQDALTRFAAGEAGARGVANRLVDDDYFALPSGVAHAPPTFLGNHDMGRAAQQVRSRAAGAGAPELLAARAARPRPALPAARRSGRLRRRRGGDDGHAAATRRLARTCSRRPWRTGAPRSGSARRRSATGRRST